MGEETQIQALLEAYLQYLEGRAPEPSLHELDESERGEVQEMFRILAATHGIDLDVQTRSVEADPVAVELGFVEPPASMVVSGTAVSEARQVGGLTRADVVGALSSLGRTADESWMAWVEESPFSEIGWEMIRSLADVLHVPPHRIVSSSASRREEPSVSAEAEPDDDLAFRVESALLSAGHVFGLDFEAKPYAGTDLGRSRFIAQHGDAVIRVCLFEEFSEADRLSAPDVQQVAEQVVRFFPETWAVATVVNDDALSCVVLDAYDLSDPIRVSSGDRGSSHVTSEMILPFQLALRRYFETVLPPWEAVELGSIVVSALDVREVAQNISHATIARIKGSRIQIPAKRLGYDRLTEGAAEIISATTVTVYEDRLQDEDLDAALVAALRNAS